MGIENLAREVIRRAVKDLRDGQVEEVRRFIERGSLDLYMRLSDYPEELDDTIRDAVLSSAMQRPILCQEILDLLNELDQKERPRGNRGLNRHTLPF